MSTNECYLVVVGKRGCGKSTVCNKLLTGRADGPFTVYRGMGASTEKFEDKHDDFEDAAVDVVDSPDVFNMGYTDHDAKSKFEEWRDRAPSDNKKTVFVFVVRMDLRFTPDDVKLYDKYIDLLPHELTDNTILAFTYTDELQEQLLDEIKLSPVKNLYKSLGERYVAFSKTDSSQQREENRTKIIQMIDRARRPATISSSSTEYRFVVVGKRGSGKSTVCNKLLTGRADGPFPDGETEKFQCHTKTRQNDTVHIVYCPDVKSMHFENLDARMTIFARWEHYPKTPNVPTAFLFPICSNNFQEHQGLYRDYFHMLPQKQKESMILVFTHTQGQNVYYQANHFAKNVFCIRKENVKCLKYVKFSENDAKHTLDEIVLILSELSKKSEGGFLSSFPALPSLRSFLPHWSLCKNSSSDGDENKIKK